MDTNEQPVEFKYGDKVRLKANLPDAGYWERVIRLRDERAVGEIISDDSDGAGEWDVAFDDVAIQFVTAELELAPDAPDPATVVAARLTELLKSLNVDTSNDDARPAALRELYAMYAALEAELAAATAALEAEHHAAYAAQEKLNHAHDYLDSFDLPRAIQGSVYTVAGRLGLLQEYVPSLWEQVRAAQQAAAQVHTEPEK